MKALKQTKQTNNYQLKEQNQLTSGKLVSKDRRAVGFVSSWLLSVLGRLALALGERLGEGRSRRREEEGATERGLWRVLGVTGGMRWSGEGRLRGGSGEEEVKRKGVRGVKWGLEGDGSNTMNQVFHH